MSKTFDTVAAGDSAIAAVRAAFNAMGRSDIALERDWLTITEREGDYVQAVLLVPIGRNLALPLKSLSCDEAPEMVLQRFANDIFKALPNVDKARWGLRRYAADIRRAAEAAIKRARDEGLDVALAGIALRPTYAWHLTQLSWKEAADHVLATVLVNGLDSHLNAAVIKFDVQQPGDVADEMVGALDRQKEFQDKRDDRGKTGASVAVDVVTLRILFEHDLGFETISEVVRAGHKNVELTMRDGTKGHLYLVSSHGAVQSSLQSDADGAFRWYSDCVELPTDPNWAGVDTLVGRDLAVLAGSDLFKGLTVQSGRKSGAALTELKVEVPTRLFNAETGQFLRQAA